MRKRITSRLLRIWSACLAGLALVACASTPVRSEPVHASTGGNPESAARVIFKDGVWYAERGKWEDALSRFRQAYAYHRAPRIVYNIASALEHVNDPAAAAAMFQLLARDSEAPPSVRQAASARHRRLLRKLLRLTIQVQAPKPGQQVFLDGQPLPPARIGTSMLVPAGDHVIQLRGPKQVGAPMIDQRTGRWSAGGSVVVQLIQKRDPDTEVLTPAFLAPRTASLTDHLP